MARGGMAAPRRISFAGKVRIKNQLQGIKKFALTQFPLQNLKMIRTNFIVLIKSQLTNSIIQMSVFEERCKFELPNLNYQRLNYPRTAQLQNRMLVRHAKGLFDAEQAAYFWPTLYTTYMANMGTMRAGLPTGLTIRQESINVKAADLKGSNYRQQRWERLLRRVRRVARHRDVNRTKRTEYEYEYEYEARKGEIDAIQRREGGGGEKLLAEDQRVKPTIKASLRSHAFLHYERRDEY
ncbi:hypothetical protein WN51_05115 [Melipona quadrifasciata]|uniref:Uncharacterized protein n=1 Tax=Melipona quadrifasciata TaxID=166423 RepID=A0A0N0BCW9_9HYME|nr:hypothetical protein WN51_05115 [Melipona quadrifasciata]